MLEFVSFGTKNFDRSVDTKTMADKVIESHGFAYASNEGVMSYLP